jgi:hypothetical protein
MGGYKLLLPEARAHFVLSLIRLIARLIPHSNSTLRFLEIHRMQSNRASLKKWKMKWDVRIEVLSMREHEECWDGILALLKKRGVTKAKRKSWYEEQKKHLKEVSVNSFRLQLLTSRIDTSYS